MSNEFQEPSGFICEKCGAKINSENAWDIDGKIICKSCVINAVNAEIGRAHV